MHELLSLDQRVRRARRRRGEIAIWRVRETRPIASWSFDAKPIGLGIEAPAGDGPGLAHPPDGDLAKPPARSANALVETEQLMHGRRLAEDRGAAESWSGAPPRLLE